jgi:hypothetical protein
MRKKIVHEVNKVMLNILYYEFVNKIRFIKQLSERIAFNHSYNKLINLTKKLFSFILNQIILIYSKLLSCDI